MCFSYKMSDINKNLCNNLLFTLFCLFTFVSSSRNLADVTALSSQSKQIVIRGDIMIGGLFPMHEKGSGSDVCGAIKEDKGIQRVEAMLFALDRINRSSEILPGVNLGAHILDTCLQDTYALEQSLEFIKSHFSSLEYLDESCARRHQAISPISGVIGAAASPVSIAVANILRLFKVGITPIPSFILSFQQ